MLKATFNYQNHFFWLPRNSIEGVRISAYKKDGYGSQWLYTVRPAGKIERDLQPGGTYRLSDSELEGQEPHCCMSQAKSIPQVRYRHIRIYIIICIL